MSKDEKSFICNIYFKARESEKLNIDGEKKSFITRNGRYLIVLITSICLSCALLKGYSIYFLQLGATILSILIGLFLTVLVFALDKFYVKDDGIENYKLDINEKEIDVSLEKLNFDNSQNKTIKNHAFKYVQQFNFLVGKSVIVGVWALALICINIMCVDFFSANLCDYKFVPITIQSFLLFLKLSFNFLLRFLILYYMVEVFYNTIRIISSMVNFMSIRIQIANQTEKNKK